MRVLLAGFGPFPGTPFNPSAALALALACRRRPALAGIDRSAHVFATTYAAVDQDLPKLFAQRPDVVLVFGLAARRRHICIETRARNTRSVLFPDAGGYRPRHSIITAGAPSALIGRAPFERSLRALKASGLPARLSRDAGRYLCNYAYWCALQRAHGSRAIVQFVHIPAIATPSRLRRHSRQRLPTLPQLVGAVENLLIAIVAAAPPLTLRPKTLAVPSRDSRLAHRVMRWE